MTTIKIVKILFFNNLNLCKKLFLKTLIILEITIVLRSID